MDDIIVKYESYYSYNGRLETPKVSYSTWSLPDFASSYCVPDIADAVQHFGVVPPRHLMNEAFERGVSINRAFGPDTKTGYSWTPFRISEDEYDVLSTELTSDARLYTAIADETLWSCNDIDEWADAVKQKAGADPTYTRLSWAYQHALLGIPVGREQWIPRNRDFENRKFVKVDPILRPLKDFFRGMEDCTPDCCGFSAFDFCEEKVFQSADKVGRARVMNQLTNAEIDLGELDPSIEVLDSRMLRTRLMRDELAALFEHFTTVLSGRSSTSSTYAQ